jgi:hypothetical protein
MPNLFSQNSDSELKLSFGTKLYDSDEEDNFSPKVSLRFATKNPTNDYDLSKYDDSMEGTQITPKAKMDKLVAGYQADFS